MPSECILCHRETIINDAWLCSFCQPDTCVNCHVDDVNFKDGKFKCSHGCQYDVHEYTYKRVYTTILNGDWRDKLSLAGERVEYIIPEPENVRVYDEAPKKRKFGTVLATHYTDEKERLLDAGFENDYERDKGRNELFEGTIRESPAIYGWPFPPGIAEEHLSWEGETVILEIPIDNVYVSSYRFADWAGNQEINEDAIPPDKYIEYLTFTPGQLYRVSAERNMPVPISKLF